VGWDESQGRAEFAATQPPFNFLIFG